MISYRVMFVSSDFLEKHIAHYDEWPSKRQLANWIRHEGRPEWALIEDYASYPILPKQYYMCVLYDNNNKVICNIVVMEEK
jgi:hypothetical protein